MHARGPHPHLASSVARALVACAVGVTGLLMPAVARAAPAVHVELATQKIRPTDPAPASPVTRAHVFAARNEFAPFQVVVEGPATGVWATLPPLTGPGGVPLPATDVRLYREGYVTTVYPSTSDVTVGRWPDPLIPDVDVTANEKRDAFPFDVPSGENRVIWVDLLVPMDAAPGDYTGTLTVTGQGGSTDVPVTLTVYPFTLPSTPSLDSIFGSGWDALCVGYYPGGYADPKCGDAGVIRLDQQLGTFLLDHRISTSMIYTGPSPSGSGYDWATWDATWGPFLDGTAPTRLPGAKLSLIQYEWKRNVTDYAAWAAHFRQKGWLDRTFDYTLDEPHTASDWQTFVTRADLVHQANPAMRTLVTGTVQDATKYGALGDLDILTPVINYMDDKGTGPYAGSQRSAYDAFVAGGGKLMWYQSCMSEGCYGGTGGGKSYSGYNLGWPSMMIDTPAVYNRVEEWLSYLYGISGELYFDTTYAFDSGGDAWQSQWYFGGNGDGTLLYPGTPARIGGTTPVPVASIRLDLVRQGMQDYEYLHLLTTLGGGDYARQEALKVATSPHDIDPDPAVMEAAREAVAARIVALTTGGADGGMADGGMADGGGAADGGGTNTDGGVPDPGSRPSGTGCGCSATGATGSAGLALVLLVAAGLRRRRPRPAP